MLDVRSQSIQVLPSRYEMAPIRFHLVLNVPRLFHLNLHIRL